MVAPDALGTLDDGALNGAMAIFLPGLDLDDDRPDMVSSAVAQLSETARVLRDKAKVTALMVLTFNVNPARNDDGDAVVKPAAGPAALWGAGRSIRFEAPGLPPCARSIFRVEMTPNGRCGWPAASCRNCPRSTTRSRFAAMSCLRRVFVRSNRSKPNRRSRVRTVIYLIAGGAGALGRRLTEWLAAKGVDSFLWLGLSEPGAIARDM